MKIMKGVTCPPGVPLDSRPPTGTVNSGLTGAALTAEEPIVTGAELTELRPTGTTEVKGEALAVGRDEVVLTFLSTNGLADVGSADVSLGDFLAATG